ncbi:coatomer subunit gamma, partial [Cryomyces antarcticus]
GGYEFKRSVVESIFDLIKFVPESKEDALAHLCEFIEDCEFTKLAVRILHLLGMEGPNTAQPTKYIRYIYNRVVLENAIVRAAAVTALAKFGVGQKDPEVKRSVHVLLTRCLDDTDDEVRDRAALNLRLMTEPDEMANKFIRNDSMFSLPVLERQLVMYVTAESLSTFANPFDLSSVPIVTREQSLAEDRTKKLTTATPTLKAPSTGPKPASRGGNVETAAAATAAAQKYAQQLQAVPELASYGGVLKSSAIVELTESETEYVVSAVKHLFKEHVVLQFDIKNTLPDTILADVTVVATPSEGEDGSAPALEEDFIIPAPQLKTDEPGTVYVSFRRTEGDLSFVAASFTNVLKFTSKEIDPTTGKPEEDGYEDEYQVEDLELTGADYVIPAFAGSFDVVWEQANGEEASETLQLSNSKNIAGKCSFPLPSPSSNRSPSLSTQIRDATESLIATLSLQPVEGTEVVLTPSTHTLRLYGKTVSGGKVAAQVRMAFSAKSGVTMKIDVRAEEEGVAALMIGGVS